MLDFFSKLMEDRDYQIAALGGQIQVHLVSDHMFEAKFQAKQKKLEDEIKQREDRITFYAEQLEGKVLIIQVTNRMEN